MENASVGVQEDNIRSLRKQEPLLPDSIRVIIADSVAPFLKDDVTGFQVVNEIERNLCRTGVERITGAVMDHGKRIFQSVFSK